MVAQVFPVMISITLTIVFVLIGLAFQSIVAPLRSVGSRLRRLIRYAVLALGAPHLTTPSGLPPRFGSTFYIVVDGLR